jgi:hypothetical protein
MVERAIQITTQASQVQACASMSGVADPFNGYPRNRWLP